MAVVTVANDSVRSHDMGDTDGTTGIGSVGAGGAGAGLEPDFFFQGANSISRKVGTTLGGFEVDPLITAVDMTAADRSLWMCKVLAANKDALLSVGSPALEVWIGTDASNYFEIDLAGNESEFYPLKGGWLIVPINPNLAAFQSTENGTVTLSDIDYIAVEGDFSATSKSENVMMDAIDIGIGLTLVGGDGSGPAGTLQDFIDDDQGEVTNGRFGFFTVLDDVISVFGMNWIGRNASATTTATVYNDSGRNIVFPDGLFGDGDCGFSFDLGNASTDVDIESYVMTGVGRRNRQRFTTESAPGVGDGINSTNELIQSPEILAAFRAGDAVIVRDLDGGNTTGLTDGQRYWVGKAIDGTVPVGISMHTTRRDAMLESGSPGSGTPVNLTGQTPGNAEVWRLDKDNDTRPQIITTGTSGEFDLTGGTYTEFGVITLTSVGTMIGGTYNHCGLINQNGGRIEGNTFNGHETIEGEAFIVADDLVDIVGNAFDNSGGLGHAVESTETGTISRNFVGNTFAAFTYFSGTDQTLHQFDTITDVDAATDRITLGVDHGYGAGTPVVYSEVLTANTDSIGLTDETIYYVRPVGVLNEVTLHLNEGDALNNNAIINLNDGATGETHALWPANAAFFNNGASATALTLSVSDGDSPSVRNAIDCTTIVENTVALTFTPLQTNSEVRLYLTGTNTAIDGVENSGASFVASAPASTAIDYKIVNPGFLEINIKNVSFATSQNVIVNQQIDRDFDPVD